MKKGLTVIVLLLVFPVIAVAEPAEKPHPASTPEHWLRHWYEASREPGSTLDPVKILHESATRGDADLVLRGLEDTLGKGGPQGTTPEAKEILDKLVGALVIEGKEEQARQIVGGITQPVARRDLRLRLASSQYLANLISADQLERQFQRNARAPRLPDWTPLDADQLLARTLRDGLITRPTVEAGFAPRIVFPDSGLNDDRAMEFGATFNIALLSLDREALLELAPQARRHLSKTEAQRTVDYIRKRDKQLAYEFTERLGSGLAGVMQRSASEFADELISKGRYQAARRIVQQHYGNDWERSFNYRLATHYARSGKIEQYMNEIDQEGLAGVIAARHVTHVINGHGAEKARQLHAFFVEHNRDYRSFNAEAVEVAIEYSSGNQAAYNAKIRDVTSTWDPRVGSQMRVQMVMGLLSAVGDAEGAAACAAWLVKNGVEIIPRGRQWGTLTPQAVLAIQEHHSDRWRESMIRDTVRDYVDEERWDDLQTLIEGFEPEPLLLNDLIRALDR